MTLGTIHALRGEQQEKVVGNLIYMDPEEGRRALELYVHQIVDMNFCSFDASSLHASACYPPGHHMAVLRAVQCVDCIFQYPR